MKPLGTMILPVSGECNLNCGYCYRANKRSGKFGVMSEEMLEEFIRKYMGYNSVNPAFGWQGGEPLLAGIDYYDKVVKLQKEYNPGNALISNNIQTNGTLINKDWACFFKENRFLVGVSLDGPAEYNDFVRTDASGKPTFKRVLNGIKVLKEYDVDYNILLVIHKYNVRHAVKILKFFANNGLKYIQLIPCIDFCEKTGDVTKFSIEPEEYAGFLCTFFDEWVKQDDPGFYINMIDIIMHSYLGFVPPYCVFNKGCADIITVDINGDVYPCDFFVADKWKLGNIAHDTIGKMFTTDVYREYMRKMNDIPVECRDCKWFFACRGGCMRYNRFLPRGQAGNYLCSAYKEIFPYYFEGFNKIMNGRNSRLKRLMSGLLSF